MRGPLTRRVGGRGRELAAQDIEQVRFGAELRAQANAMTTIEKNSAAAEQAFLATLELDAYRAGAYRGLGWAYLHQKRYKESAAAFMKYLKMKPAASDRPIIIDQLHKIMAKIKSG
ncbi:MAG: hypothetical protein IIB77_11795 [Proteobacteria bacterium]|nr:hypothetical protein [Pseudomonadota bacterium]